MSRQHPSQQDHGPFYASDATLSFTTNREEPLKWPPLQWRITLFGRQMQEGSPALARRCAVTCGAPEQLHGTNSVLFGYTQTGRPGASFWLCQLATPR